MKAHLKNIKDLLDIQPQKKESKDKNSLFNRF